MTRAEGLFTAIRRPRSHAHDRQDIIWPSMGLQGGTITPSMGVGWVSRVSEAREIYRVILSYTLYIDVCHAHPELSIVAVDSHASCLSIGHQNRPAARSRQVRLTD